LLTLHHLCFIFMHVLPYLVTCISTLAHSASSLFHLHASCMSYPILSPVFLPVPWLVSRPWPWPYGLHLLPSLYVCPRVHSFISLVFRSFHSSIGSFHSSLGLLVRSTAWGDELQ
jgi:hypothetical protein